MIISFFWQVLIRVCIGSETPSKVILLINRDRQKILRHHLQNTAGLGKNQYDWLAITLEI